MTITTIIQTNPRISIIVLSFIVTLFITIVNYFMTDRKRMKEIKEKQKKMMEINKQMMEDMPEQLKHSFKPMLVTIIPLLILFKWLRATFAITALAGSWFWWYIIASIVFSMILRKVFGLQ